MPISQDSVSIQIHLSKLWVSYPVVLCTAKLDDLGMAKPSPKHSGNQVLIDLGVAIRNVRLGSGLSQESLAVDAGLDRSYMGGIERGEHNLTVMNIVKVANALGIKPSELLKSAKL
jgi:ribosome-binding protein aMBF1 (putative translation factor)